MRRWVIAGAILVAIVVVAFGALAVMDGSAIEPTEAMGAPRFAEDTSTSGIAHRYTGDWRFFEGGGVAAFDCSGDDLPDLYIAGGAGTAALYRNESEPGGPLEFSAPDVPEIQLEGVTGAYPIDVDSDGVTDLAVLRMGENRILRGLGDCRFEDAGEALGFDGGDEWTVGFSATWEDGNTLPTLAFGNYLKRTDLSAERDLCSPNVLLRPDGAAYDTAMPLDPAWCSLSVLFSDWDRDGSADLRVTNDRQYNRDGEEQLWALDEMRPYERDDGWKLVRIWGMGIASQDVTDDGYPEVFLTSQGDNKLQTLADGPDRPAYTDIAIRRGVTAHRPYVGDNTLASTAWHPEFEDVNNDGFVDLYISKGNVDAMPDFSSEDPNNLLLGQPDGTFVEGGVEAGIVTMDKTRGAAVVDLNADGLLDLVEVNREAPVRVWRNVGSGTADDPAPMGSWIEVRPHQAGVNPDAIGSWVEVRVGDHVITREVTIGGGHAGGQLGWIHIGLGPSDVAEVRVIWPGGEAGPWLPVNAGDRALIEHGDPDVVSTGVPE